MGFFFQEQKPANLSSKKLPINSARLLGCKICTLNKAKITSPKMDAEGCDKPDFYFLFSKVSYEQDYEGSYVGGDEVSFLLEKLDQDTYDRSRFNAVTNCFSKKTISELETMCCRVRVEDDIVKSAPKVIVAVGGESLNWLIGEAYERIYAGKFIPIKVRSHECWLYTIHDPAFIQSKQRVKKKKDGSTYIQKSEWDQHFDSHIEALEPFLENYKKPWIPLKAQWASDIDWTVDSSDVGLKQVFKWLDYFQNLDDVISLDIETNQLSPYKPDSRMLSISIGTYEYTVAFPYVYREGFWSKKQLEQLHKRLLEFFLKTKKFVCHNAKFEQEWLAVIFGKQILKDWNKWECSQAQAYSINELMKTHSLDFLIMQYFGFKLKIISNLDRKDLEKHSLEQILPYNGLDVKWTYLLYKKQKEILEDLGMMRPYTDLKRSSATLAITQINGVLPDHDATLEFFNDFDSKIKSLEERIKLLPDVKKFEARNGKFNIDAPAQVLVFLKTFCKDQMDEFNFNNADESVLTTIQHPITKLLLENRALVKKKGTYIDPIFKHSDTVDGYIHASFNHLFTSTSRLSCNDPNLQNFPNRKGKVIRRVIKAPENHWVVCSDYGQIEGRLIAVATQDPVYCKAIWEGIDVHMDWALKISQAYPPIVGGEEFLDDKKAIKKFRSDVKNQWTFPQFYGSSIYNIAKGMGIPIEIMLEINEEFWGVFGGIKKWQDWLVKFYKKHGYVETLMGHRRHGPLSFNEIINTPIQGTAGRLCVNAMNKVCDADIRTVMQIHDDITSYIPDETLEQDIMTIAEIMCDTSDYPWLNVPIAVEMTYGKNWYDQEEIDTFTSTEFIDVPRRLHKDFDFYKEFLQ